MIDRSSVIRISFLDRLSNDSCIITTTRSPSYPGEKVCYRRPPPVTAPQGIHVSFVGIEPETSICRCCSIKSHRRPAPPLYSHFLPRFGTTTLTSMGLVINNSVRQIPGPSILGMGTLVIHFGNCTRQSKCTVASLGSVPKLGNPSSSSPSPSPLFPLCLVVTGSFLCITNIYSWSPHGKPLSTSLSSCHASTYYSAMEKTGPRRSPPYET